MNQKVTFGVIGGYGAIGRVVASELWKSCSGKVLICGRDRARSEALAAEFDGRVVAERVDVFDNDSLENFCRRCSVIVNTAAPVMVLRDRVAQAAFRANCHYVDAASLLIVKERMLLHSGQIADSGLSFVMSAGWFPGVSELLPAYAELLAMNRMDSVESVSVYYGDTSDWSRNGFRETAWLIRQLGSGWRGYFRKGKWVPVSMFRASREINLGGRVGRRRFFMSSTPELSEIGTRLSDCTFVAYGCVPGLQVAVAGALIGLLPMSQDLGARLLQNAFRKNRLPIGGFVVCKAIGAMLKDTRWR
jgi:saccharopine dehydrogenase-like NADP-dependent oxidoreductase